MYDLIIYNCHVLMMTEEGQPEIRRNQDIIIDESRILEIQPTDPTETAQAHRVIEANEMLAMPGLINTHAHVPMVIFRGLAEDVSIERWFNEFMWPLESNLTEEDVYWGMLLGLVEMIEGIQKPDSGGIRIMGRHWKGNEDELHRIIGLSLQETRFIDKLRVSETLLLFAKFFNLGRERVDEIIEIVGLQDKRKSYVVNLSGGQRQRLALGIALINTPAILLLD